MLWTIRTSSRTLARETPFSMVCSAKAIRASLNFSGSRCNFNHKMGPETKFMAFTDLHSLKCVFEKFGGGVRLGQVISRKMKFNGSLIKVKFVEDSSVFYNFGPHAISCYT